MLFHPLKTSYTTAYYNPLPGTPFIPLLCPPGLYYMATGNDILAGMAFEMADKINVEAAKKLQEMEAAAAAAAAATTTAAAAASMKPAEDGKRENVPPYFLYKDGNR